MLLVKMNINSIFALPNGKNDSVAQLVEQYTFNVWVLGSSPSGITKSHLNKDGFFLFYPILKEFQDFQTGHRYQIISNENNNLVNKSVNKKYLFFC